MIKNFILSLLFNPPYVHYCSQTIYQALLGSLKMYQYTNEEKWKIRSQLLVSKLIKIQQEDGGFDIGYEFNFGLLHRVGESTSPEMFGLISLIAYGKTFGFDTVMTSIEKAVDWIKRFVIKIDHGLYAIPYAPYTTKEIMIYNGTSFSAAALGYYLGILGDRNSLEEIYVGMIKYLFNNLEVSTNNKGKFWYYKDQNRTGLSENDKIKIDYYHQMQQVEVHAYAQSVNPIQTQKELIECAADHILDKQNKNGSLPYTNDDRFFKGNIYIWGFASVISGFLKAAEVIPKRKEEYQYAALNASNFLIKHAWNGNYFEPVINKFGEHIKFQKYMVRSDAWVFSSLASLYGFKPDKYIYNILDKCYLKMHSADFSGPETHASTKKTRYIGKKLVIIKNILHS